MCFLILDQPVVLILSSDVWLDVFTLHNIGLDEHEPCECDHVLYMLEKLIYWLSIGQCSRQTLIITLVLMKIICAGRVCARIVSYYPARMRKG